MLAPLAPPVHAARQMERLDRGLVAISQGGGKVFLSWRVWGTDQAGIAFNLYRDGKLLNAMPITGATNFVDTEGSASAKYTVRAIAQGVEENADPAVAPWDSPRLSLALRSPGPNYEPNDLSVGDVDGDGRYEIFVKWNPANAKDNSQSGVTDNVYLDVYKLEGTFLWRVDLGINIRAGAHYTQYQVADYDGDGKAELIVKTAPGAKDGTGAYLSTGAAASADNTKDYRNREGYILSGPEWLTLFDGRSGKELHTVDYLPGRGSVSGWGDGYGNRVDRFIAYTAWLDGVHPSAVFQRGYYTRMALTAWDVVDHKLVKRWAFDRPAQRGQDGQGNHNGSVADVDGDGKDEIFTGSVAINADGTLRWDNRLGHGDAMHLGVMDPELGGLQIWSVKEGAVGGINSSVLVDAKTGKPIWGLNSDSDVGRGLAADVDANHKGYEMWSSTSGGVYDAKGKKISSNRPSMNFRIYWDGDLLDEILDGGKIDKWNGNGTTRLATLSGATCNGTKNTPNLAADILGDWREEVILHDATHLFIHTSTIPTANRLYTLMHDPVYRAAIAWQNSSYNQPPHLGFWLGAGVDKAPRPDIAYPGPPTGTSKRPGSWSSSTNGRKSGKIFVSGSMVPCSQEISGPVEIRELDGSLAARGTAFGGEIALDRPLTAGVRLVSMVAAGAKPHERPTTEP
ncbi:MAG: rhamnogalacturonan lyase [Fibrobacteria bacterium]|nr:rhamnogalacturonan lyase [Fibrobacteria bacterium]